MYQTVNFYQFHDAFMSIRPNNFTHEGLQALFEYCEDYERDTGETMELDVIALCCDITEDQPLNIANGYNIDLTDINLDDMPKVRETVLGYLCEHTTVIGQTDNSILFVNF
tara:strand:+ start:956 stop:1288 length:333 start_codon:yes stop_codon:yes gene_type:complete